MNLYSVAVGSKKNDLSLLRATRVTAEYVFC